MRVPQSESRTTGPGFSLLERFAFGFLRFRVEGLGFRVEGLRFRV